MILTLTCSTNISDSVPSPLQTIARGLSQVIVFLFIHLYQTISQTIRNRIAIAYRNDIRLILKGFKVSNGSIASHNMSSVLQQGERNGVNREIAVS